MDRLRRYFLDAETCSASNRKFGIELETLFVDSLRGRPITLEVSQLMMRDMVEVHGWKVVTRHKGLISELLKDETCLKYDVGWNLFELITPPLPVSEKGLLFSNLYGHARELYDCAERHGGVYLHTHFDGDDSNTLIPATPLEDLYWELNGPSFSHLGHIAAIHYNIDLMSVEEGMQWMERMEGFYAKNGWPPRESVEQWRKFMRDAYTDYEPGRFGPPPLEFEQYLKTMAGFKVYFNTKDGEVFIEKPPRPFPLCQEVDLYWFVGLVWWWTRFRVRGHMLALEIRAVPRKTDEDILLDFERIRQALCF